MNFSGGSDGANPVASLIFDSAGNLYDTIYAGGLYIQGLAFELSPASIGMGTPPRATAYTCSCVVTNPSYIDPGNT
jgi:hypothetical protein